MRNFFKSNNFLALLIYIACVLGAILYVWPARGDTPPPNTVKAKMYSGDGDTAITSTSGALNVNVTNSSTVSTVDQGTAGSDPWLMSIVNSSLPVTGTLTCNAGSGTFSVDGSGHTQPVSGTFWQATQPVSVASLPLPTGAATEATLSSINTKVLTNTQLRATPIDVVGVVDQGDAGSQAWLVNASGSTVSISGTVPVSGTFWQATQPVSGTFWQTTQPVSAASLPLPSGAATEATLSTINTKTPSLGQALAAGSVPVVLTASQLSTLTPLSSVSVSGSTVSIDGTVPVSGTFWQATQPVSGTVTANAGSGTFTVDGSGHTQPVSGTFWQATQPVSAASLPLPSGAATALKQPALGTAGTASTDVITVQGIGSMVPLLVNGSGFTQPVSGSVSLIGSTVSISGTVPVSGTFWQATQPVSGTVTANAGSGTFTVNGSGFTQPVSGTFWQATQPVSGTVTANIGTSGSLALDASVTGLQVTQNSTTSGESGTLVQGATTTSAPTYTTAKTNPLSLTTAGALRVDGSGVTQPVSGTVTANAGSGTFTVNGSGFTQPVSAASLPLPSGAATESSLSAVNGKLATLGQKTMSGSVPVTVASDQSNLNTNVDRGPIPSTVTGTLSAAGSSVVFDCTTAAAEIVALQVTGTWVGQVDFEATIDGTTWIPNYGVDFILLDGQNYLNTSANGYFLMNTAGFKKVRVHNVGAMTGSASIVMTGSQGTSIISALQAYTFVKNSGDFDVQNVTGTVSLPTGAATESTLSTLNTKVPSGLTVTSTRLLTNVTGTVSSQALAPAATTVKQAAITIGTSAVRLTTDGSAPSSTRSLLVAQLLSSSTANCYMGSSSVTSSGSTRGTQMFAGQSFSFNFDAGDYYAICDTASQTFLITEQE